VSRPDVEPLLTAFRRDLAAASSPEAIDAIRREHTGKNSPLKALLRGLKDVPADERPAVAKAINDAAAQVDAELDAAAKAVEQRATDARLAAEWIDWTMPGTAPRRGARHPLTVIEDRSLAVLRQLGFELVDGPEVEDAYHNFDALNIPEHHPARDMQDTFWVTGGLLLRSHTTTVQARVLEKSPSLPFRVASMGRVYRNEAVDATHLAMFHQFEGMWVDRGLTFAHLKGVLAYVAKALFADRPIRFKPKFYPYTEPSIGVDLSCGRCGGSRVRDGAPCEACHGAGWVTILGAGMIHPKVFAGFGFDPNEVSGIAFGLGTTRMAGQSTGVSKIKSLYETDLRVHEALARGAR
jgi:phenylalanyl-tRNA synthetase alpha chain